MGRRLHSWPRRCRRPSILEALSVVAAAAGVWSALVVPGWERVLHAQNYQEFGSISDQILRDADQERRVIGRRLEQAMTDNDSSATSSPYHPISPSGLPEQIVTRPQFKKWGVFLSLDRNTIRRHRSQRENGSRSEIPGILLGIDRRLSDHLVLGIAAGFKFTDLSFDNPNPPSSGRYHPGTYGRQRTSSATLGPYLSYTPDGSWYVNGSLIGAAFSTRTERSHPTNLTGTARGETEGYRLSLGVTGGYDWQFSALRVGPHVAFGYDYLIVHGFTESGRTADRRFLLKLDGTTNTALSAKAGLGTSYAIRMLGGTVSPNLRLDFLYRSLDYSIAQATFANDQKQYFPRDHPDRTSMQVGIGAQYALPNYLSFWFEYQTDFLERFYTRERVVIGVRKQF